MLNDKQKKINIFTEINKLADTWWNIEDIEEVEEYLKNPDNINHDEIEDLYNELINC